MVCCLSYTAIISSQQPNLQHHHQLQQPKQNSIHGGMAHLPAAEIAARRNAASQDIIAQWQLTQGQEWYAIQCPCRIDCGCMPEDEIPRLVLDKCMYPGELDYFFVTQPFQATYNFKVRWHCDECHSELACGEPNL